MKLLEHIRNIEIKTYKRYSLVVVLSPEVFSKIENAMHDLQKVIIIDRELFDAGYATIVTTAVCYVCLDVKE